MLGFRLRIITDNTVYRDAEFLGYLLEPASVSTAATTLSLHLGEACDF